jgi:hypothetical protein
MQTTPTIIFCIILIDTKIIYSNLFDIRNNFFIQIDNNKIRINLFEIWIIYFKIKPLIKSNCISIV